MRNQNSITRTSESTVQNTTVQNTKRILIIEQSESVGLLYKSILLQQGYTILTATCGQEAIALLDSFRPNLIVTADQLADMNSDQLRRRVTVNTRESAVPFLILSVQKTAQFYSTSPTMTLNETLFLPFRIKDLRGSVQRLLGAEQVDGKNFYYPSNPESSYQSQSYQSQPIRAEMSLHAYA